MTVYIFLLGFVVISALICKIKKLHPKYFLFLAFTGMTVVLGLRGASVEEDTVMYLKVAESAMQKSWGDILSSFLNMEWNYISYGLYGGYSEQTETLYMLYNKSIMTIFHNPQLGLIIIAAITHFFMARFILENVEDRKNIYFATYVYMCNALFMCSFNTMCQILAISIALLSIKEVKYQKYKKAVLWILIAALIHKSAILFASVYMLYLIRNKQRNYKYLLVGTCILLMIMPLLILLTGKISPHYVTYLQVSFWKTQANGVFLLWIIIVAVVILAIKSKKVQITLGG